MKKLLPLFLLLLCSPAFAQDDYITTTPDGSKFARWTPTCSVCDTFTSDGQIFRIFDTKDFYLSYQLADDSDYYVANVFLVNKSKERIEFDPAQSTIAIWPEKDKNRKGQPTIYYPIPAEKIAAKLQNRAKWANFFSALGGAMATKQTTTNTAETGNVGGTIYNGNSTSTTTTPDYQAQARSRAQIADNNATAASRAEFYANNDLKANTVFPEKTIAGNIYFPRKKFAGLMLGVKIKDVLYIIQYTPPEKKK